MHDLTFHSVREFAESVKSSQGPYRPSRNDDEWAQGSMQDAYRMAEKGFSDLRADVLAVTESALTFVETERPVSTFHSEFDVSGSSVDVGRFLADVPECMLETYPIEVSRVGRVITVCASVAYSGSQTAASLYKRGAAIVALCEALQQTQHAVEIWADSTWTSYGSSSRNRPPTARVRVLVKGAHDVVDIDKIAFALAHPAFLRRLVFGYFQSHPELGHTTDNGYGYPCNPIEDMPEGTIYLPCVRSVSDIPDSHTFVTDTLRRIGLLAEDDV